MGSSAVDEEEELRVFFEAVDEDKAGEISLDQFYTLFLGLGFAHEFMQKKELSEMVARAKTQRRERLSPSSIRPNTQDDDDDDSSTLVTIDIALNVFSQAKISRDRDREISHCYRLIDSELRGISAADIQRLSNEVGDPVSLDYARAMIAASLEETGDSRSTTRVSEASFRNLLMPK